jgi:hypothetical protein
MTGTEAFVEGEDGTDGTDEEGFGAAEATTVRLSLVKRDM